jgi:uncharacterized delta-60 repeat protein
MPSIRPVKELVAATLAALAALGACGSAAPAAQAPGRLVFAFPDGGGVRVGAPRSYGASAVTVLSDGRIVVAGVRPARRLVVAQLTAQGAPDEPFGVSGFVWPSLPTPATPVQVLAQPDGRLLVVASGVAASAYQLPDLVLVRLTASGKGDPTFGRGGVVILHDVQAGCASCPLAALAPDGRIVLAATTGSQSPASSFQFTVIRLTPDGALDPAFGQGGAVIVPGGGITKAVAVQPDGAIVATGVRGNTASGYTGVLTRLTPTGAADPSFAGGTPVRAPFAFPHQLLTGPEGSILVLGSDGDRAALARYTSAGAPDAGYGDQGVVRLAESVQGITSRMLPGPDGQALVVAAPRGATVSNDVLVPAGGVVVVTRLGADGRADPALGGDAGLTVRLGFGGGDLNRRGEGRLYQNTFDPSSVGAVAQRADGSLVLAGEVHVGAYNGEGSGRFISRPAVAALTTGFALDPSFGASETLRLSARVRTQRAKLSGVSVSLRSSQPGLAAVSLRAAGHTIARGIVPLFIAGAQQVKAPFTAYGKRLLARHRRIRVRVTVSARDLAGNTAQAVGAGTVSSLAGGDHARAGGEVSKASSAA